MIDCKLVLTLDEVNYFISIIENSFSLTTQEADRLYDLLKRLLAYKKCLENYLISSNK